MSEERSVESSDPEVEIIGEENIEAILNTIQKSNIKVNIKKDITKFIRSCIRDNLDAKTTLRFYRQKTSRSSEKVRSTDFYA